MKFFMELKGSCAYSEGINCEAGVIDKVQTVVGGCAKYMELCSSGYIMLRKQSASIPRVSK
jgi:hypothetical protein